MKRIILSILILFTVGNSYAQQDLIEKFAKQAVLIDSLKKVIKLENEYVTNNQITIKKLLDTIKIKVDSIKNFELISIELGELQEEISSKETEIQYKRDSIASLKSLILEREKQIIFEKQNSLTIAKEEKENGKNELLIRVINNYKNKIFDDLLTLSIKELVQQDLILVSRSSKIEPLLSDIILYFNVKELLQNRFDAFKTKNLQNKLSEIRRESASVDKLTETLSNYQMITDGLKETVQKILTLDQGETVSGMPVDIQKQKLNKILTEISLYIFNYDIIVSDYPYLSDVILEIIKRKHPDPDADILDLLEKL